MNENGKKCIECGGETRAIQVLDRGEGPRRDVRELRMDFAAWRPKGLTSPKLKNWEESNLL
jgi:hypothetical protein